MQTSRRRRSAQLLLTLVVLALAAPLLADDECDEACGSHCGDCAWCPLMAELQSDSDSVCLHPTDVLVRPDRGALSAFARALDHVPITL